MLDKLRALMGRRAGTFPPGATFEQKLRSLQPESVWCLDFLKLEGDTLTLDGWALVPGGSAPAFVVNGTVADLDYGSPRPDLERLMFFDPMAKNSGFHATVKGAGPLARNSDRLEIQLCERASLTCLNPNHNFYWPLSLPPFPFPDADRRRRVHGDPYPDGFILSGFSTYTKVVAALGRLGRSWGDFGHLLDWGCGCGRVLRYLPAGSMKGLVGADIDKDNISWCSTAFPDARFSEVPLNPPTALPGDHFDFILGVSVFTHLREGPEKLWLRELHRIARKGAILFVTIHGPTAAARSNVSEAAFGEWMSRGFLATGRNLDLAGVISDDDYYVNTLHRHSYVRKEWSRYFEIVEIVEGYIANHQDLVVMRKR
ncbi:MAG TPA: methyltransferase domain-containing protein [Opitutaceae bacterium]|jgi:SAM-dependent methyltransferase